MKVKPRRQAAEKDATSRPRVPPTALLDKTREFRAVTSRRCGTLGTRPADHPLTASAFAEDRERWFEAGMDDYLSKPVRSE